MVGTPVTWKVKFGIHQRGPTLNTIITYKNNKLWTSPNFCFALLAWYSESCLIRPAVFILVIPLTWCVTIVVRCSFILVWDLWFTIYHPAVLSSGHSFRYGTFRFNEPCNINPVDLSWHLKLVSPLTWENETYVYGIQRTQMCILSSLRLINLVNKSLQYWLIIVQGVSCVGLIPLNQF